MAPELGDYITLHGTTLLVRGIQAGKPVSEFTSGLRVGRATYDDRQHAFFTVLDDFSGGFAHHTLDIREAVGTHWDNVGGVDVRRSRHIILPPKRYVIDASAQPTNMILSREILDGAASPVPTDNTSDSSFYYYGAGDRIYRMDKDRDALTSIYDASGLSPAPHKMTRMFLFRGSDGTRRLYVITTNPTINSKFLFSANPGAVSPTFTQGNQNLWDAMVFENVVLAQDTTFQFIFNTNPTAASDWNINDVNDAEPVWRAQSIVRFMGVAIAPWGNAPAVYFIDYGDGRLYALNFYIRKAIPIEIGDFHYLLNGVVWGGQVAVTDGWGIWLYSPGGGGQEVVRDISLFGKDGIPESIQDGFYKVLGLLDGGAFLFAIAERTGGGKASNIGFAIFVYNGAGWSYYYPKVESAMSDAAQATNPIAAIIDRFPSDVGAAFIAAAETTRRLNILCQAHPTTAKLVKVHSFHWPKIGEVPMAEFDEFQSDDNHLIKTGWFDGGFSDIEGALFYLKVDLRKGSATLPVQVSFRLDDDESAAFTVLGEAVAKGNTTFQFAASNQGLQFRTVQFQFGLRRENQTTLNGAIISTTLSIVLTSGTELPTTGGKIQIDNEVIRYASRSGNTLTVTSTADRGIDGTTAASHANLAGVECLNLTPEVRGITIVYRKKPAIRRTWVVQVDVNAMVEKGTLVDTDLDGTPETAATHQNVLDFIEGIWSRKTLVHLVVPNQIPSGDNARVEIADFTRNVDDNRLSSTLRGIVNLSLIEPVNSAS